MNISQKRAEEIRRQEKGPLDITAEGLRKLEEKLAHYKKIAPDLAAEAARTAAYGDRSDNAEYKQAKGALRHANYEILRIQDQIKRAVIISSAGNTSGKVELGSTVVIALRIAGKESEGQKTFKILGPHETNPDRGIISDKSPLGAALIGHTIGDIIAIKTESGSQEYRIIEIF
jgi:transcription elongation factor GreA